MKNNKTIIAGVMSVFALASCTSDSIDYSAGTLPEPDGHDKAAIVLTTGKTPDNFVRLTMTEGSTDSYTDDLYLKTGNPSETYVTAYMEYAGADFVREYSEQTGTEYALLPAGFYELSAGNTLSLDEGAVRGGKNEFTVRVKSSAGAALAPGRYLLRGTPSSMTELSGSPLTIDLTVLPRYTDPDGIQLYTGNQLFTVCYLNTAAFDPRLANDMILCRQISLIDAPYTELVNDKHGVGNLIVLRTAYVGWDDATEKVSVVPAPDLRYCLDNYSVRIRPVQESGRKVLVCIDGGGKGIGFSNFTDAQITDFTAAVKRLLDTYGLDGINLWDRKAGYDKAEANGFPPVNKTSYPKLVKSLREALGKDKLVTLVDYDEPTAHFHDVSLTGGIEVGKYIDYAWHGYVDPSKDVPVIDPWNQDLPYVSKDYPRRPIAGLDRSRYGCLHGYVTRKDIGTNTGEWIYDNYSNSFFVFYDIRSHVQDEFEFSTEDVSGFIAACYTKTHTSNDRFRFHISRDPDRVDNFKITGNNYNKWAKNW